MRNDTMRFTSWTASAALVATLAASPAAAQNEQAQYVVAGPAGVTIRNMRDKTESPVARCGPGTVLKVHEARGMWTQVEPAGGLTCWVLGAHLTETEISGKYKVNGNGVNMRPLPSTAKDSFPLEQHLYLGDMVRMVGRKDPSALFERDWIQIHTPQGVYGYTLSSALMAAPDATEAAATWEGEWRAISAAMSGPKETPKADATDAPKAETEGQLVRAHRMMNESPPKYDEARELFEVVLMSAPQGGAIAKAARNGMNQADAYASIEALQRQLETERVEREREQAARAAELERRRTESTPLMGKYDGRGWIEMRKMRGGEMGWYLRFAGRDTCVVQCSSGRYDLSMFEGYEVGVIGRMTNDVGAVQPTCDIRSIEVLSGRPR